jgi:hypothetical protein
MKQVLRKGLKDIVVDEVPDPVPNAHHVLVRPHCSLISAGTETADIHTEGLIRGVAENPGHIRTIIDAMKVAGHRRRGLREAQGIRRARLLWRGRPR